MAGSYVAQLIEFGGLLFVMAGAILAAVILASKGRKDDAVLLLLAVIPPVGYLISQVVTAVASVHP